MTALTNEQYETLLGMARAVRDSSHWTVDQDTVIRMVDEIHHWRADAAVRLELAIKRHDQAATDLELQSEIFVRDIMPTHAALRDAMEGSVLQACDACDKPLLVGQPVLPTADWGEMHAACLGATNAKVGDVLSVPRDMTEHAPQSADGSVVIEVTAYADGFDEVEIQAVMQRSAEFMDRAS